MVSGIVNHVMKRLRSTILQVNLEKPMVVHMMLHEEMDGLKITHGLMYFGKPNGINRHAMSRQRSIRLEMSFIKGAVERIVKPIRWDG